MRRGKPGNKRTEYGKAVVFAGALCLMVLVGGCGKKDDDLAGRQVLEISITPEPTPTPVPEQLNPDAVVTEGSLTMVNGYLVEGVGTTRKGKGKLNTGASEEENPDAGEEGKTDAGEGDINSEDGTDINSDEENTDSEDEESADSEKSEDTDSDTSSSE